MKGKFLGVLLTIILISTQGKAQFFNELVQFSGIVINKAEMKPAPFVNIVNRSRFTGNISDYSGYFSIVVNAGDTIEFTAVGYKTKKFYLPAEIKSNFYSKVIELERDTLEVPLVDIYPWPSPEEFKEVFLALDVPDDDLERAKKNLDPAYLAQSRAAMPRDGTEIGKFYFRQEAGKLYYKGQLPPNNLLNPIAWAKFFEMIKNGELRNDD